jgi:alpha-mannosidase
VSEHDGIGQSLTIELVYRIPRALAHGDRSRRSQELVNLPITTRLSLTPGIRRVEFETTVSNQAEDHRLRVHFPTPVVTDRSWAEGHFDVVARPIALPADTAGWAEQPTGTHPQLTFTEVSDGVHGVMLANRGLPEYEALPGTEASPGVTLALTLLRCVGWLSRGDLHNRTGHAGPAEPTPEAQCPGEHRFQYALIPHAGNYLTSQHEAHAFSAGLRAVCTGARPGPVPVRGSFLEISPDAAVLTGLKLPEEGKGLILRLYNSADTPVQARIKLWRPFKQAALVPLHEEGPGQPLSRDSDTMTVPLTAKEIATLRLTG